MSKRLLRKSNHTSIPYDSNGDGLKRYRQDIRTEVLDILTDVDGNKWLRDQATLEFEIAKKLVYALPIVPTNERVYHAYKLILSGAFSDISPVESHDQFWQYWVAQYKIILIDNGVLI